MHQILIKEMKFFTHKDGPDFQKNDGREYLLDLILDFGYVQTANQDDLDNKTDYSKVYDLLKEYFKQLKIDSIEYACSGIIDLLLNFDTTIIAVEAILQETPVVKDRKSPYIAVRQKRKRNNLVYLSIGSNLNNPTVQLDQAIEHIKDLEEVSHCRASTYYQTAAWGKSDQADFVNAAIEFIYKGSPFKLLQQCQEIELKMGRKRVVKWGPRLIDIDIIFFDDLEINHPDLTIPHPYFRERDFVMDPILELKRKSSCENI